MPLRPRPNEDQIRPALVPVEGSMARDPIFLTDPAVVLGSGDSAQICLKSEAVSKAHALLLVQQGKGYLRDLASRTHLFVNDEQVTREVLLKNGDVIRVGNYSFSFLENAAVRFHLHSAPPRPIAFSLERSGEIRHFTGSTVLIGRRQGSDLLVEDDAASGAHAVVFCLGEKWYLRDLGSRTGTIVNEIRRIEKEHVALCPHDVIRVGPLRARFLGTASTPAVRRKATPAGVGGVGSAFVTTSKISAIATNGSVPAGLLPSEGFEEKAFGTTAGEREDLDRIRAPEPAPVVARLATKESALDTALENRSDFGAEAAVESIDLGTRRLDDATGSNMPAQDVAPPKSEVDRNAEVGGSPIQKAHVEIMSITRNQVLADGNTTTYETASSNEVVHHKIGESYPVATAGPVSSAGPEKGPEEFRNSARNSLPATPEGNADHPVQVWSFDELSRRNRENTEVRQESPPPTSPGTGRRRLLIAIAFLICLLSLAIVAGIFAVRGL